MDTAPLQNPDNQQVSSVGTKISNSNSSPKEKPEKGRDKSIFIVTVIIVIAAVFLVLYFTGTLSHFIQVSGAPSSASIFSSVSSPTQLNSAIASLVNSSNTFNISYAGSHINLSSYSSSFGAGSPYEEDIVSYVSKYGNAFKVFFSGAISGEPVGVYYMVDNNTNLNFCNVFFGTFDCSNHIIGFTVSKYLTYNYLSWLLAGNINTSQINSLVNPYNISQSLDGVAVKYGKIDYLGNKIYKGNKCSEVSGSVSADGVADNSTVTAYHYFNLCFSDSFGLPLEGYVDTTINISSDGIYDFANVSDVVVSQVNSAPTNLNSILSIPKSGFNPTQNSINGSSCSNFTLSLSNYSSHVYGSCSWNGGNINLTYAGGDSGYASVSIIGQNNKTYFSNSTTFRGTFCGIAASSYVYLPPQNYVIRLGAGNGGGFCGNAFVSLS